MTDFLFLLFKVLPLSLGYSFVSNYFYFYVLFKSKAGKRIFFKKKLYQHEPDKAEAFKTFKLAILSETMFGTVFIALINSHEPFLKEFVNVRWGLEGENFGVLILEALSLFVLNEIYHYSIHNLIHHRKLFKSFHALHHTIRYPIPQSASVAQWTEQSLFVLPFIVLLFCNVHIISILMFSTVIKFFSLIQHSGHEFIPDSVRNSFPLKYLNTGSYHQVHHSRSIHHNFGFVTNVLDRIFKTKFDP
jgi:lathosterol oxidase